MRNKETISGIAFILLGNGGAGVLAWFGQTILALVLSVLFTVGGIILLIIAFRIRGKNGKPPNNDLKIGAKLGEIETFGYCDKALDDGSLKGDKTEGNKLLKIDIILSPLKPMTLDILALELWGKRFYVEKLPETTIKETSNYMMLFIVPKEFAIDTKEARIYALAGNSEWYSEPFPIIFGG